MLMRDSNIECVILINVVVEGKHGGVEKVAPPFLYLGKEVEVPHFGESKGLECF